MWDGGTARQIGLVDGFGGIQDAVAKAAQLAKLGNERGVRYLETRPNLRDQLIEALASKDNDSAAPGDAFSLLARQPEQQLTSVIAEVTESCVAPASRRAASNAPRSPPLGSSSVI